MAAQDTPLTCASDNDRQAAPPGAGLALALLLLINLLNYIDRWVLAAVEPQVRQTLLLSSGASGANARAKMGLLSTAFLVTYMLSAPVFGLLAERWRRWGLIAVGVGLWSLASGTSGLAAGYTAMLITRCFVGIGEGAYGPIAPALISDLYPVSVRGRVMSWFYMAIPVGSALGYALGGQMAKWDIARQSWRWAFFVVVVPGLLLALWALAMRDPPQGAADREGTRRRATWADYAILARTPSYLLDTLGMTATFLALGAIAWWMPDYLESRGVTRVFGLEPPTFLGVVTAVAGLMGTLGGGLAGDWLRPWIPGSYFLVSGLGLLATVPCVLAFLVVPFPLAWVFVFLAEFFLFFNTGPSNTILANVTHPSIRATAFALNILVIHALGDAVSPAIVGAIADRWSLTHGFVAVTGFLLIGGVAWLFGTRYLAADTLAAPHRL
jgi:MFS family permease